MLVFDALKEKKLEMVIETKGIEPSNLKFVFRIIIEGIEYGFPCTLIGTKVSVVIPPLSEVVAREFNVGNYDAKLEVTGENKYYLNPFAEKIKVKLEPEVEVTLEHSEEDIEEQALDEAEVKMSSIVDEDIEKPKNVKEEKKDDKKDEACDKNKAIKPKAKKKIKKKKSKLAKSL